MAFHSNSNAMQHTAHTLRTKALREAFSGLTYFQVTTTDEWDALTCDEQMYVEQEIL